MEGQARVDWNDSRTHTTVDLVQVGQEREGVLVAERNEENTVVGQGGEGGVDSHFLTPTKCTGGNEDTGVLATKGTLGPETTGGVPEGLCSNHESTSVISPDRRAGKPGITFH